MRVVPPAVDELARRLTGLGCVTDLWVAGSLATGDYVPGVSDIDLVALVADPVDESRQAWLWWREEGGMSVRFGSDAHEPELVGGGLTAAVATVAAHDFRES